MPALLRGCRAEEDTAEPPGGGAGQDGAGRGGVSRSLDRGPDLQIPLGPGPALPPWTCRGRGRGGGDTWEKGVPSREWNCLLRPAPGLPPSLRLACPLLAIDL